MHTAEAVAEAQAEAEVEAAKATTRIVRGLVTPKPQETPTSE